MFDIGWSEMAVIALVALLVFGPKELPNALRTGAKWMKTARKLAREFQSSVDQLVKEAELEEARKLVTDVQTGGIGRAIEKTVDPEGEVKKALDPKEIEREAKAVVEPPPAAQSVSSESKPELAALTAPDGATVPMPVETKPEPVTLAAPDAATVPMPQPRPADAAEPASSASPSDSLQKTA
ncbi:MAG TPA: Sec-independent protein translocase protein TatB [Hypericibacter adhaerens]|uniref:Sec-independent protein translocase protein TatB n=1 Tax=Hypericibacter adhaerens TaxID=2602016 RepID=UPI002BD7FECC|nr:Sec-independent protein translocase protein TatB [Hypericibacter adhaerens]HWA43225.1 Sec-independent protein translocase protein TatB [Hypericibacter adhaerens]